ncbi:MAG: hypothetical protein II754_00375 [Lachnospiraceae bacterium]|nr:hypothetical protein [Lachnospiraceae bacterium]
MLAEKDNNPAPDNLLLVYMRGKSAQEIKALTDRSNGTAEEKLALAKELGDYALRSADLGAFEMNPEEPEGVLSNLAEKLTMAEASGSADKAIPTDVLLNANREKANELKLDENWKKELKALGSFSKDHLRMRMNLLVSTAEQGDPGTLGAFSMADMHRLKADRARIREVIKAPGEKTAEQETAALFFETTNTLIQNAVEVGELKYGQVQKKASIESALDPVYQTYRQKEGLLGEGAAFGGLKKQIHDRIGKINANPLYSSREDLHNLRELCIATLSDYVQDIPENTWYELPTAVLKTLAMKKLKDDMPNDVIRGIVNDHLTKEKEKDLERQEPEWTEKEKDALDLIGDICDGKKGLKAILANHAEILTDLAMTRKKGQAHADEQQKLLDKLKDKNDKLEALDLEIVKKEQASTAAFHALDANQASLTKLEAEKSALLGAAGETVGRAEELKHQVEKCDERRKLENASEEDRAYYEAEYRKNKEALETLLSSEEYRTAMQEVSQAVQTDRYMELEDQIQTMQEMVGTLSEEAAKADQAHKDLKEQQKNAEKEIDELNEAIEKQQKEAPMDVYSVMASKMAGPERALAAAVSKALLKVTEHLANKHGDEAFKLKNIRELAEQEDPELDQLLAEASKELETELQKMYQDVAAKVAEASEFILEDVTRPQRAFAEETGMQSSGESQPLEEWKTHFYNEEDRKRDLQQMKPLLEENERRKKKEEELNKPLLEEIERQKQEREAELKSLREERLKKSREANLKLDKEMKGENIFVPKTLRELELEKPFVPEIQLKKVPTVQEELEQLKKERLEKSRKMNEGRKENDQIFVPKTLRELELERLASLEADTGVEGLYVRQLHRRYLYTNYNFAPDQETLQTLYDRNWALDDTQEGDKRKQPGEGAFVRNVMQNYFTKANKADQRSMMTTLIRSLKPAIRDRAHAHTNDTIRAGQYMAGLLLGAGPLAQKLMQGVPERYLMTEMKGAVRAVKSKLAPIPDEYVKQKFQEMIDKSNLQITEIKKLRSLGAASVGQAFLCEISGPKYKNKQVVIKLLRPEADERVERDTAVMLECAKMTSPGMEETYKGQLSKIKEELRLTNEADNCKGAENVYKEYTENEGSSDTVHVLPEIKPEKDYLVLDKAEGITVDRYIEELDQERQELQKPFHLPVVDRETGRVTLDVEYKQTSSNVGLFKSTRLGLIHKLKELNLRQKHIRKTTELWIKESLFGKGYYHGDMHAGNIMVSDKNATVLDYGNATKLSENQVKNITGMSAAAMFKDPRSFLDGFLTLLPKEKVDALTGANLEDEDAAFEQLKRFTEIKNAIRQDLYKIFSLGTKNDSGMRIYLGLQAIQKYGIEIPISLFSYCQSQVRLQNTLEDLNGMETSIRADLTRLDRAGTVFNAPTFGDMMMSAIKKGSKSANPENFYRNLVTATDEVKEEDFVREVSDVSQENSEAFDAKYLSVFKQIDDLMSGKAILKAEDDDEEDQIIPIPVIETEKWKTSYEAYMKMREEDPDGKQTQTLKAKLKKAIEDSFTNPKSGFDNGLLAPFGGQNAAVELTYDAIECGDRNAFRKLMKIFDEQVLPCVQFMRDLRQFREDYKENTGFFSFFSAKKIDPVEKEKKAKELFASFKKVRDVYSDMNETVKNTREELNMDRNFYVEENSAQKVYEADLKRVFRHEGVVDLTGLESLKNQWKTLEDRKKDNALSPDEEKQYARVSTELVNTYKLLAGVYTEKESYRPVFDQNIASWYVLPGGEELQKAYEEFRAIQDKDIEARLKKWDDDTYAEEREKASKKFMDIYKKMANVRMKDYVQAFDESVPPMETEEYEDEHGVKQTKQPDFASMMGRVMEGGTRIKIPFTDIEFTTNQKKMGDAIGMDKAMAYANGSFVPGQDLVDDITKLQKPVRKKGGQPAQPIQEAPKEVQQE